MAARSAGFRSSRSSFATLASGSRSGCPVPNTKRSTPTVPSNVPRWSSGALQIQVMSHQMRGSLLRRRTKMHFLDKCAVRVRDNETHALVAPQQRAHRRCRQFCGGVIGMPLTSVLESNGHDEADSRRRAGSGEPAHFHTSRVETVVGRVAPDRRHFAVGRITEHVLPPFQSRMHCRHRSQSPLGTRRLVEPLVAITRTAPEETREVAHPCFVDPHAVDRMQERVGGGARYTAVWISAQEGVHVDAHQSDGNAEGGKMRAAFLHFTRSRSSRSRPADARGIATLPTRCRV